MAAAGKGGVAWSAARAVKEVFQVSGESARVCSSYSGSRYSYSSFNRCWAVQFRRSKFGCTSPFNNAFGIFSGQKSALTAAASGRPDEAAAGPLDRERDGPDRDVTESARAHSYILS